MDVPDATDPRVEVRLELQDDGVVMMRDDGAMEDDGTMVDDGTMADDGTMVFEEKKKKGSVITWRGREA